jgi:hypothetical protein
MYAVADPSDHFASGLMGRDLKRDGRLRQTRRAERRGRLQGLSTPDWVLKIRLMS